MRTKPPARILHLVLAVLVAGVALVAAGVTGAASHATTPQAGDGIECSPLHSGTVKSQQCIRKDGDVVQVSTYFQSRTSRCQVQQSLWQRTSSGTHLLVHGVVKRCNQYQIDGPRYETTRAIQYYATARVYPQGVANPTIGYSLKTVISSPRPPGFPTGCNTFMEYGQYLYFFSCDPWSGTAVDLLSFGGDWHSVCVRDQYVARWDRGGYAGYRVSSKRPCLWDNVPPADRQPAH